MQNLKQPKPNRKEFSFLPWGILSKTKNESGLTQKDKTILGTLLRFVDENGKVSLTNQEIVSYSETLNKNPKKYPQNKIRNNLKRLTERGYLKTYNQNGSNRYFIINPELMPYKTALGLSVQKEIISTPLSQQKKQVLACRIAFPNMKVYTMADKLGMSPRSVSSHIRSLVKNGHLKVNTNHKNDLVKTRIQPSENSYPSTRYSLGYSVRLSSSILSDDNILYNNLDKEDDVLHTRFCDIIDIKTKKKFPIENHIEETQMLTNQQSSLFKEFNTPTKGNRKYAELELLKTQCPRLTIRGVDTKSYKRSIRVIKGLKKGLINEYGTGMMNQIAANLCSYGITKSQVVKIFHKQFTLDERQNLYKSLERLRDPGYLPNTSREISLDTALWSLGNGVKSWLVYVMVKPPERKIEFTAEDIIEREGALEYLRKGWFVFNPIPEKLTQNIERMQRFYKKSLLPRIVKDDKYAKLCDGGFVPFVTKYCRWISIEYPHMDPEEAQINPGWFKPESKPFQAFIAQFKEYLAPLQMGVRDFNDWLARVYENLKYDGSGYTWHCGYGT